MAATRPSPSVGDEPPSDCGHGPHVEVSAPARRGPEVRAGGCFALAPAVVLLALPKCPLCLLAYGGFFSALGLSAFEPIYRIGLLPLTVIALSFAVGAVGWLSRREKRWGLLAVAFASAVAVVAGKFWLSSTPLTLAGLVALLGAIVRLTMMQRGGWQRAVAVEDVEQVRSGSG